MDELVPALFRELDFGLERRNCERAARHFKGWRDVCVPRTFAETSTERVLTMSFEEGIRVRTSCLLMPP